MNAALRAQIDAWVARLRAEESTPGACWRCDALGERVCGLCGTCQAVLRAVGHPAWAFLN